MNESEVLDQSIEVLVAKLQALVEWAGSDSDKRQAAIQVMDRLANKEMGGAWREDYMKLFDKYIRMLDPVSFSLDKKVRKEDDRHVKIDYIHNVNDPKSKTGTLKIPLNR